MTEINQDFLKKILDYNPETGVFTRKVRTAMCVQVGQIAGSVKPDGYRAITILGKPLREHRLAWLYIYGSYPNGVIDHINGKRDDNRISNLRVVSVGENATNRRRNVKSVSGYKGVTWYKRYKKWQCHIRVNKKGYFLGFFDSPERAALAYDIAARKMHGKFARVNFPLCNEAAA